MKLALILSTIIVLWRMDSWLMNPPGWQFVRTFQDDLLRYNRCADAARMK